MWPRVDIFYRTYLNQNTESVSWTCKRSSWLLKKMILKGFFLCLVLWTHKDSSLCGGSSNYTIDQLIPSRFPAFYPSSPCSVYARWGRRTPPWTWNGFACLLRRNLQYIGRRTSRLRTSTQSFGYFFYSPAEDVRLRFQLPDGGKELNLPNPWTKSTRLVVNFSGCEQRTVDKHLKVSFLPNPHGEVSKLDKSIESRFQCSAMHSP